MEWLFVWFVCAVVAGIVAASRGRTGFGWFLLGCMFGIFALILVALLPSRASASADEPTPVTHVRCPDCRELVRNEARKCKHCGASLVPQSELPPVSITKRFVDVLTRPR